MWLKKIILRLIVPIAAFLILAGCAGTRPVTRSVTFVLFGNTKPVSPFTGFTESLPDVLEAIVNSKPEIIIHTGNSVYGGSDSDGIFEQDVNRQMKIFFSSLKKLRTAAYTLPGTSDYYNKSLRLYCANSGRKPYYSFNYGTIHFITLNTDDSIDNLLDPAQMEWLKSELEDSKQYSSIFVITHHPVYAEEKSKGKGILKNTGLMQLFTEYKVKAVFSGKEEKYTCNIKDNVAYYMTGCGGYTDKKENRKKNQFYSVTAYSDRLEIIPSRIEINK